MKRHRTFVFSTFCIDLHFDCSVFYHILKVLLRELIKTTSLVTIEVSSIADILSLLLFQYR